MESLMYLVTTLRERFQELLGKEGRQIEHVSKWHAVILQICEIVSKNEHKIAYIYLQTKDFSTIGRGFWRDPRKDKVILELNNLNKWLSEK